MKKEEIKQIRRKVLMYFILFHIGMSAAHIIVNNFNHPLFSVASTWPLGFQIALVSLVVFIVYVLGGYILVVGIENKRLLYLSFNSSLVLFTLLLMSVYAILYFLSLNFTHKNIMLFYSIFHSLYGTYMYRLDNDALYSLWWMVSTIIPSLGLYLGFRVRMKHEEKRI